LILQP